MTLTRSALNLTRYLPLILVCGLAIPAFGRPVPQNLGQGLDKLVESNLILNGQLKAPAEAQQRKSGRRGASKTVNWDGDGIQIGAISDS